MSESNKTEIYGKVGNDILEENNMGFILPPIFYHTCIERPEDSNSEDYRKRVAGAETEYVVFKAFEKLLKDEPSLIVLHSFKINEKYLKDLGIEEGKNKIFGNETTTESEHDFIVIDKVNRRFIAVEVKSESEREKGKVQLDRIERFIKKICPESHVVKVLAFPSDTSKNEYEEEYKELFQDSFVPPSGLSLSWENISKHSGGQPENFVGQYENSEVQPESIDEGFDRAIKLLVGLWAKENEKSEIEIIKKIDDRLKRAILYQGKETREKTTKSNITICQNPPAKTTIGNTETLQLIHDHLEIKSLTREQIDILNDTEKKQCIIRGPAGSGKTILMLAQIIKLTNTPDKKPIVIISHKKEIVKDIKKALEKCKLKVDELCLGKCNIEIKPKEMTLCDVLIIYKDYSSPNTKFEDETLETVLRPLSPFHLFVDNLQHSYFLKQELAAAIPKLKDLTEYLWLLCDSMQHYDFRWLDGETENRAHEQVFSLKKTFKEEQILKDVVRNTFEISEASIAMRKHSMEVNSLVIECETFHLIHGPRPHLRVITEACETSIKASRKQFVERYKNTRLAVVYTDTNLKSALLADDSTKIEFEDFFSTQCLTSLLQCSDCWTCDEFALHHKY